MHFARGLNRGLKDPRATSCLFFVPFWNIDIEKRPSVHEMRIDGRYSLSGSTQNKQEFSRGSFRPLLSPLAKCIFCGIILHKNLGNACKKADLAGQYETWLVAGGTPATRGSPKPLLWVRILLPLPNLHLVLDTIWVKIFFYLQRLRNPATTGLLSLLLFSGWGKNLPCR